MASGMGVRHLPATCRPPESPPGQQPPLTQQPFRLQVEGCTNDLTHLRAFYLRLRICGEPTRRRRLLPGHSEFSRAPSQPPPPVLS